MMQIRQKGVAVKFSRTIGGTFLFASIISLLGWLASIPLLIADGVYKIDMLAAQILIPLFLTAGMVWIGSYYFTMFPDIEVRDDGIVVRGVISKKSFPWSDIEGISETRRIPRAKVIVLRRKGLFLYRLHGVLKAELRDKPVILVSPKAENVQELFETLERKIQSRQIIVGAE